MHKATGNVESLLVVAGAGIYPRLVVEGARRAGVPKITVLAFKGSTERATARAADSVHWISVGSIAAGFDWCAACGCTGLVLAGQISPLSLFRSRFDAPTRRLLAELPVKNAHSIYGRVIEELARRGVEVFPASSYMDGCLPGAGVLTERSPDSRESSDIAHAAAVARDIGRHDVGQTVVVKEGMILAVEAFDGTNATIRRAGRLGGKGAVVFKAAREGHDMRFDIPVVGTKTVKNLVKAGASALAFQAGRLVMLEPEKTIALANRHHIAVVGVPTDLPPAPLRPR